MEVFGFGSEFLVTVTRRIKPTNRTTPEGQFSTAILFTRFSIDSTGTVMAGIKLNAISSLHLMVGVAERVDLTFFVISDLSSLNCASNIS